MEVIKNGSVPEEDASNAPIFYGGEVTRQPIVGGDKTESYNFGMVSFAAGAKNHFHTHTSDQILYATGGRGYVASETEQIEMEPGDTAFIPAGEKHWHGATDDSAFSHISLTRPDSTTEVFN
ncbi:MAG: cupin domain-containing protein [SAR202 cluster bacterium]|jgi:quercetin dioxygenase-like cupin family protein|nr:cupin domain-containing protein [SAR202 cluster bacterium]MDP6302106.1 cupin domain-containing protein [SAR202 cluster bacterium]MDP7226588.1 cupin domain-containing protein [SAR202 cluster bacterium]